MHSTIAYALFGMNMDRPPKLQEAFQKTLDSFKAYSTALPEGESKILNR
jgi:hypothetical protein